jgi:hypothetical protein
VLSGLLYIDAWFLAKAPDAVPRTIATEKTILVLLNMAVTPRLSIEVVFRRMGSQEHMTYSPDGNGLDR